jgi:pimeloyl-ACP methyl ester carboxylesterase
MKMSTTCWLFLLCAPAAVAAAGFDANLTGYAYPFQVQRFSLTSQKQSLEMAYMDVESPKPTGKTVLLLHGKNFAAGYWGPTMKRLLASGYRVIAPDQIGFGKSTKPEHFQFSFHELASHTRALLDHLKVPQVDLIGHSIGGMLAVRFALMFPGHVRRLALVGPIGLEDWKRQVPYHPVAETFAEELKSTPERVRQYMKVNYFAGKWLPEYEPYATVQAGWISGPDWPRMAWISALTTDMAFTQPVLYDFPDLALPVLLIVGSLDRTAIGKAWAPPAVQARLGNYLELGRRAAAAISHCTLLEIAGAGHLPQATHFDAYWQAIATFLGR